MNTGEVEFDRLNVSCETANGYTYLRGISGGVDPNSLCIYDYMGDPVLELDMVWNVTAMGDKLCISQAIEYDRSFRILTYGDGGLEPIYEVELLDGQTLLYAMVCGGMLNYSYYDQDSFDMTNSIVDLYTFDDITGVYPELGETLSIIYQTGDFKYYCTMSNVYFAGPGYVFAVRAPYGEGEYYSHFFVNGCVIEVDTYNGIINTLTPPVA
ncbi:MAG: hypothetical protein IIX84_02790 [Oscillospiraceae bacterium]|nr:hypothetical protein [Oscillospiraceae bacterium]